MRALAEQADTVIAITMFQGLATGWADLVLPATSYLERDGTLMNLEGRLQRLRRAVVPPVPDELAWISRLAERFGVDRRSARGRRLRGALAARLPRPFRSTRCDAQAPLAGRAPYAAPEPAREARAPAAPKPDEHFLGDLRLLRYRPLFSGPQVERVPELQFQRPAPELELSAADADARALATGDTVLVRSNGTSVELRARVNRRLVAGVARVAEEHAGELHAMVEVVKA